ncbi:Dbl homology domain-containing protein [Chlamydoabsidia padenii]|nr:Dbl homology domain-containing protein [Chlamydoabsidia padenii]
MSSFYTSPNQNTSSEDYDLAKRSNADNRQSKKEQDYYYLDENSSVSSYATTTGSGRSMLQRGISQNKPSESMYDILNTSEFYDDDDTTTLDYEMSHRSREALIQQLYTSEATYLQSLDLIMHLFLYPLRNDWVQSNSSSSSMSFLSGSKKPICTQRELQWLFCNLDDIYQLHKSILKAVEQRLSSSGASQIISDILHDKIFNSLGRYYGTYLDNYHIIVSTYERLKSYAPFKKFIELAHKDPALKGATLLSLLQIPTGCVNRYVQITTRLSDATHYMHPEYMKLQYVNRDMLGLSEEIRPRIENADNVDQVLLIHQALVEAPFSIHADRRLILQRDLIKVTLSPSVTRRRSVSNNTNLFISMDGLKKANMVERTVVLFSDLLLYVQPRQDTRRTVLQYKGHIDLESARVQPLSPYETGGLDYCFEIISGVRGVDTINTTILGGAQSHVFQTKSQEEQEDWVYHLSSVITDLGRSAAKDRLRLMQEQKSRSLLSKQDTNKSNTSI